MKDLGRTDIGVFKCCVYVLDMFLGVYEPETSLQPLQLKQHQFSFLLGSATWFTHSLITHSFTNSFLKEIFTDCLLCGRGYKMPQLQDFRLGNGPNNLPLIHKKFWEDQGKREPRMEFLEQHDLYAKIDTFRKIMLHQDNAANRSSREEWWQQLTFIKYLLCARHHCRMLVSSYISWSSPQLREHWGHPFYRWGTRCLSTQCAQPQGNYKHKDSPVILLKHVCEQWLISNELKYNLARIR